MDRLVRARVLVAEAQALGLTVDDLVAVSTKASKTVSSAPTVSEYLTSIIPTFTRGTLRGYRPYWRLAEAVFGDRPIDSIDVTDCEAVLAATVRRARQRRPGSDARSPRENCIAALRALFRRAERARLILENPPAELEKPRRLPNRRRGLTEAELGEVIDAVRTTSRDPDLDLLIVRFHLESGVRQEGALGMVLDDMDGRRCTVWHEKGGKEREQPISPSLTAALREHAVSRGAACGSDAVLRTAAGRPVTRRHDDTLFKHVRAALPWSVRTPVTSHVLRHTAGIAVERIAGLAVAETFLGHAPASTTGIYTKGWLDEVAAVVAVITGEAHPLAPATGDGHAA